jgi:hypothetical protein
MTIDREPGGSTMIRVSLDIRDQLNALKEHPREAIGDVVKRLVRNDQKLHKILGDTHTKERLENDLKTVTDPNVPDETDPKKIWQAAHPDERLMPMDVIHHINGYHDDDRAENLMRVTMSEHGKIHAEIRGSVQKPIPRPLGCLAPDIPDA